MIITHAVSYYRTILTNKHHWVIDAYTNTKEQTSGWLDLPPLSKRFTVAFTSSTLNTYKHLDIGKISEAELLIERNAFVADLLKQKRKTHLFDGVESLASLCAPGRALSAMILPLPAAAPPAGTTSSTTTATTTTTTSTSAEDPDQRRLVVAPLRAPQRKELKGGPQGRVAVAAPRAAAEEALSTPRGIFPEGRPPLSTPMRPLKARGGVSSSGAESGGPSRPSPPALAGSGGKGKGSEVESELNESLEEKVGAIKRKFVDMHTNDAYTHRDRVVEAGDTFSKECFAYCQHLRRERKHDTKHYTQNFNLPPYDVRRATLTELAPRLYSVVYDSLVSDHHRVKSAANAKKVKKGVTDEAKAGEVEEENEKMNERAEDVMRKAVEMCEMIISMHSGSTVMTHSKQRLSVLLYLGHVSKRIFALLCSDGLVMSYAQTATMVRGYMEWKLQKVKEEIAKNSLMLDRVHLVMIDNYAVQQFAKFMHTNKAFTHNTATIAVLFRTLLRVESSPVNDANHDVDGAAGGVGGTGGVGSAGGLGGGVQGAGAAAAGPAPRRPAYEPYNTDKVLESVCGDGIILPAHIASIVDTDKQYQGVRNFKVLPNLDGKSSSHADTDRLIKQDLLTGLFGADKNEVLLMSDTEYILSFARLMGIDPEKMRNVVFVPPLFHIKMHTLQNAVNEPVMLRLIHIPYYKYMGLQDDKNNKKDKLIDTKMKNAIRGSLPRASGAAAAAEGDAADAPRPETFVDLARRRLQEINIANDADEYARGDGEDENDYERYVDGDVHAAAGAMPAAHMHNNTQAEGGWAERLETTFTFIEQGHCEKGSAFTYADKQATAINYARTGYLHQLLTAAIRTVPAPPPTASWAARAVHDHMTNCVGALCIDPVADIVLNGSGSQFMSKLHKIVQYLSYCRRDKVVRSLLTICGCMLHILEQRPDLMKLVMKHITKLNDHVIELHNSLTQRCLRDNGLHSPGEVAHAAQVSELKREFLEAVEKDMGLKNPSSSKGKGEVYLDEVRHMKQKALAEQEKVRAWYIGHLDLLDRMGKAQDARAAAALAANKGLFTVAARLQHGKSRLPEVQQKYTTYLKREKKKAERQAHQRAAAATNEAEGNEAEGEEVEEDEEYKFMEKFHLPMLKAYLRFRKETCSAWAKPRCIHTILGTYSIEEYLQFIVENDLQTDEKANEYITGLKRAREIMTQQGAARQQQLQEPQQST